MIIEIKISNTMVFIVSFSLNEVVMFSCRFLLQYQEPIPCEQLVSTLCDIKQAYTQFGGKLCRISTVSYHILHKCFVTSIINMFFKTNLLACVISYVNMIVLVH